VLSTSPTIVIVPGSRVIVVKISMHMAERPMVGPMLGPAVETFIVRAVMGTVGIIVELPMPGVIAIVTIVIAVGQHGRGHRDEADGGCSYEWELHGVTPE
jgi:hypothetical protein